MNYKKVKGIQYISPYLCEANIVSCDILRMLKQKMVHDLIEKYPSTEYHSITFETLKPDGRELRELVESFKCLDGRYHYGGDFVSREFLEKELSQKDYKISMTAYVEEADNK